MRYILTPIFLLLTISIAFSQTSNFELKTQNKSRLYFYWGWNWSWFSKSDIQFKGDDYKFTLQNVVAKDKQYKFSFDTYLNPKNFTTPQYNFRIGYYFKENWDISLGLDHMIYIVQQDQTVKISGSIENTESIYNGNYEDEDIIIKEDFLQLEHSDGLNYINAELRHTTKILRLEKFKINFFAGLGLGMLVPRTNARLLNQERHDKFHVSGYGLNITSGLNLTFFNAFFIQSEFRGGFINLPNVKTTSSLSDKASHHFFFSQVNIVFGGTINLKPKGTKKEAVENKSL